MLTNFSILLQLHTFTLCTWVLYVPYYLITMGVRRYGCH